MLRNQCELALAAAAHEEAHGHRHSSTLCILSRTAVAQDQQTPLARRMSQIFLHVGFNNVEVLCVKDARAIDVVLIKLMRVNPDFLRIH